MYLNTKSLVSLITAVLSLIVFKIFGLDFAIIWAFLIFVFNFIPNFGSIVASILPITIALIQFDSILNVLWLGILIMGIQFAIGNILEPRLMGRSLNLSPLMVILSLIFWGWIWGIAGMLLAVPILGTITIIFENIDSLKFISVFLRGDKN
jgi:predicted PurR-regulated permease PerM